MPHNGANFGIGTLALRRPPIAHARRDRVRAIADCVRTSEKAKDKAAGTASAIKFSYELVEAAGGEHATFESFLIARRERRLKAERKDHSKTRRKRRSG